MWPLVLLEKNVKDKSTPCHTRKKKSSPKPPMPRVPTLKLLVAPTLPIIAPTLDVIKVAPLIWLHAFIIYNLGPL